MKKLIAVGLCLVLLCAICGINGIAEEAEEASDVTTAEESASGTPSPFHVYLSVADGAGVLVLAHEEITVFDADEDGVLTIQDALYCAHEQKYEGGAAAGYATEVTQYGLSLTKLWGVENGGSYGYYRNDASAFSLTDPIEEGDHLNAFVYTDLETWSDTYCFFQEDHVSVSGDRTLKLTLYASAYDESWNPITVPVENAVILIDGKETAFVTDAEGCVTLQFEGTGYCIVSAKKDGMVMVPPVCAVAVRGENPAPGDPAFVLFWTALALLSAFGMFRLCKRDVR